MQGRHQAGDATGSPVGDSDTACPRVVPTPTWPGSQGSAIYQLASPLGQQEGTSRHFWPFLSSSQAGDDGQRDISTGLQVSVAGSRETRYTRDDE